MLYITGDTHGEVGRFTDLNSLYGLGEGDTLVVAGDFGCIFDPKGRDEEKLDRLARLPYTILFLDGNHECFPRIYAYPQEIWCGGLVHRVRPNVLHLMRGQVFTLEDTTVFTMGGGYSIDKMWRIPGVSWWPEEMPNGREMAAGWQNLKRHGDRVDIIISHAAPEGVMQQLVDENVIQHRFNEERNLNVYLESVRQRIGHRLFYFGHMHLDRRLSPGMIALYYDVYELKSGRKLEPRTL